MASPQKENGYTPIANELIEAFYRCKLLEYERVLVLCIWRKTYGWNKKTDWVANSQLSIETGIAKPHITRTLKSLRDKKIVTSPGNKNITINKDYTQWEVEWRVTSPGNEITQKIVTSPGNKVTSPGNKKLPHQVPTKEKKENNTKDISKEGVSVTIKPMKKTTHNPMGADIIKAFEAIDPKNKNYYANVSQRTACDFLIEQYGLNAVFERIMIINKTNGQPYFPTITTPIQLRDKWVQHEKQLQRHYLKNKETNNVAF